MLRRSVLIPIKVVGFLAIVIFLGGRYIPESMFDLAPESRLPGWFTLPKGVSRADVKVTMYLYTGVFRGSAVFWLLDKNGNTLAKVRAFDRDREPQHPFANAKSGNDDLSNYYPAYEIETAKGITEVVEFKRMEPVFYINDDPEIRAKLGLTASADKANARK